MRSRLGRLWHTELNTTIELLKEGHKVPDTIQVLTTTEKIRIDYETAKQWKPIGEDLLFPLSSNEDQKEIVRRLSLMRRSGAGATRNREKSYNCKFNCASFSTRKKP